MNFPQLCTPALVYLVIAIISLLFSFMSMSAMSNLVHLVFVGLWTWFLNFLCRRGYPIVSWVLVLAPFIMIVLMFGITLDALKSYAGNPNQEDRSGQGNQQNQQ
jgi:hypothetical protein